MDSSARSPTDVPDAYLSVDPGSPCTNGPAEPRYPRIASRLGVGVRSRVRAVCPIPLVSRISDCVGTIIGAVPGSTSTQQRIPPRRPGRTRLGPHQWRHRQAGTTPLPLRRRTVNLRTGAARRSSTSRGRTHWVVCLAACWVAKGGGGRANISVASRVGCKISLGSTAEGTRGRLVLDPGLDNHSHHMVLPRTEVHPVRGHTPHLDSTSRFTALVRHPVAGSLKGPWWWT